MLHMTLSSSCVSYLHYEEIANCVVEDWHNALIIPMEKNWSAGCGGEGFKLLRVLKIV